MVACCSCSCVHVFMLPFNQVVFNGTLPSAKVLKGLPGLREIDIRLHLIAGPLPSE